MPTSGASVIGVAGLADASLSQMYSKLRNGAKVRRGMDPCASPQKPPKFSSPRLPAPSPILLSASSPSVIPTDATFSPLPVTNGSSKPAVDHLFIPIGAQPLHTTFTNLTTPSSTTWNTLTPIPRSPALAVAGTTLKVTGSDAELNERKERSKHKKKSKDKDHERNERIDHAAKKSPGAPTVTTNGSLYHNITSVLNSSNPTSTATMGADSSAANSLSCLSSISGLSWSWTRCSSSFRIFQHVSILWPTTNGSRSTCR